MCKLAMGVGEGYMISTEHWAYHTARPLIYLVVILGLISLGFPWGESGAFLWIGLGIAVACGLFRGFVRGYSTK